MKQYIVQNQSGTFDPTEQPAGMKALSALENRMFLCECDVAPLGDFVIEFPAAQQAQLVFYGYPDGKKLPFDPFKGQVAFDDEVDNKQRRAIRYSPEQLATRLQIIKWLMLNVWIPDKARRYSVPQAIVDGQVAEVNALADAVTAVTYLRKNLYYNL